MKYKVVATDFDGTLLSKEKSVSKENMKALEECKKRGCKIIGVTARNITSVKSVCDINIFDYLVSNNGACIYDFSDKKINCLYFIDKSIVYSITDEFLNNSKGLDYCTAEKYYSIKYEVPNRRAFHLEINDVKEIEEQILRINIFVERKEDIYKFKEIIENKFKDVYAIVMNDTDHPEKNAWLSLNPKGCNKAASLEYLINKLSIDMNEVIFFGDGQNDVEVIKSVGMGVAMGNALDEVKNNADYVTASNDNNGLAKHLNMLLNDGRII